MQTVTIDPINELSVRFEVPEEWELEYVDFERAELLDAAHQYWKEYRFIGSGRHRATFDLENGWVAKVPINDSGCIANCEEYEIYNGDIPHNDEIPYAECYLETIDGVPVLFMEFVRDIYHTELDGYEEPELELPGWTSGVDCCQVGYTKEGRLVAYDYSII